MIAIDIKILKNKLMKLWEKGAFHILLGSFLTKFVALFGSIFLVRAMSKSSYGMLGYIENIYGYIYIFAGMGLGNVILRYVVLAETSEGKYGYYKYAIKKGTIFNIFMVIIVGLCVFFYPQAEEFRSVHWLLIIILIALPFEFIMDSNIFAYRAMFANKRYAVTIFITSTVLIISKYVSALIWDLKGVIIARIVVNAFFCVILCVVTYKVYFKGHSPNILKKKDKKIADKYSIQYMITNGTWIIFMLNDIFLLGIYGSGAAIIADYKVAYVLPGNIAIISGAIGIFVAPYFVKHESDYEWIRRNYKKVMGITAGIIVIIVLIIIVFAKFIITFLYGSQYENVVIVMRLLLIAAFANSGLRFMTANLLAAMGQIKYNMVISFVGVLLQIVINIFMIPRYGAIGVACTSIVVYTIMALSLFVVFVKKYRLFNR